MQFKPLAMGFHSHTDVGSLDGGSTVKSKVKRAVQLGRIADVVTDHGTMAALASHHTACKKCGIKSIHGLEAYVIDPFEPTKVDKKGKTIFQYVHVTIHFKTKAAFEYFSRLTPKMEERAVIKFGERKPLMTFEELYPIANEITLGSGCLVSCVMKYIKDKDFEKAKKGYELLRSVVPEGNFFVEVFPHIIDKEWVKPEIDKKSKTILKPGYFKVNECGDDGMPLDIQKAANQFVIAMAKKYGDPIIISEDSHLAAPEDKVVQDVRLGNGLDSWRFSCSYHMGTGDEWAKNLKYQLDVKDRDIEEWIDNSYRFVDLFKGYDFSTSADRWLLPKMDDVYNVRPEETSKSKLKELIRKYGRMPSSDHPDFPIYAERLKREVSVLADNGKIDLLPYFFVIEDICNYCKDEGILFNARGSAGGSLILYLIGCTITDPIKYDLQFERFLTLGRIKAGTLPDVDMDFSDKEKVIKYLKSKYGDKVAPISIQKPLKIKTSIKDIERARFGRVRVATEDLTKMLPTIPQGVEELKWLFGYEDETTGEQIAGFIDDKDSPGAEALRKYRDDNPDIWETLIKCLGVMREKSVHACGILIASEPIQNVMPLLQVGDDLCTAYGPKDVEAVGGVKFDILGLTTLKALEITMKSIYERTGKKLEWKEFDNDPQVYDGIIAKGEVEALFQINTPTMRPFVDKTRPKNIEEGSSLIALVRPGCLDANSPDPKDKNKTAAQYYIECAQGKREPYYIHPSLKPILESSFAICLYQEQHLKIFREIGDMTYEEAEVARRAIGKKDEELLKKELAKLHKTCIEKKGFTEEQAKALTDMIAASARYAFNKSHSTSYFIVSYNGGKLKKDYPLDFWKGELTAHTGDNKRIKLYMEEASKYVVPVEVGVSDAHEWKIADDKLIPPLQTIKGVGEVAAADIKKFLETDLDTLERRSEEKEKKPVKLYRCAKCTQGLVSSKFSKERKTHADPNQRICKKCEQSYELE